MANPGGQLANVNAMRHGLRAGKLPKGCAYIQRHVLDLRVRLEDAVLAVAGEVSLVAAMMIQTACRWERHAELAQRWLRLEPNLTTDQKLAFSREVARASAERDKAIAALGIDRRQTSDLLRAAILEAKSKPVDKADAGPASDATPPALDASQGTGEPGSGVSTNGHATAADGHQAPASVAGNGTVTDWNWGAKHG